MDKNYKIKAKFEVNIDLDYSWTDDTDCLDVLVFAAKDDNLKERLLEEALEKYKKENDKSTIDGNKIIKLTKLEIK